FDFQGVTARVFPLKADFRKLQDLCDTQLNTRQGNNPDNEFKPISSYVFLMVIHYDKMFSTAQPDHDFFSKKGRPWVSQNEVAFFLPMEWCRRENGRMSFNDWAFFAPYIFVDSDVSLAAGREVYGWQKLPAWFTAGPDSDPWVNDPSQRRT